ncbi:conserved hypothetical protein [Histoplasma capsulatum var. duboisii H88]|uniref:Mitochondrial fission process protein 1 n=1 Tax=Ajellomyces capsulatus (strain H88) TaxID=544711 RepID=F0URS7_AJEC8|nr:conserved hypothetical protein [Histoplasma capsulatum var. duboisii H88]
MAWGFSKQPQADDNDDDATNKASHDDNLAIRRKLNPELQKLIDREDELLDQFYDGYAVDSTDTKYRYAAYTNRIRTILLSAHRYVAYTSDIGESFRPVAHPWLVRSAYGISWAYILGDVANEGYKAYLRNMRVLAPACDAYHNATGTMSSGLAIDAVARRKLQHKSQSTEHEETFNSTTSRAHPLPWPDPEEDTLVPWRTMKIPLGGEEYYDSHMAADWGKVLVPRWVLGLAVVPFLPYIFDKPVERGVQWAFHNAFRVIEGGQTVAPLAEDNSQTTSVIFSNLEQHREQKKQQRAMRKREQEKSE